MGGKWVYMSDNGPNSGCGIILLLIILYCLFTGQCGR